MPSYEQATALRRIVVTVILGLVISALTALVVRSAAKKVSRVQAAVSVAACRPHRGRAGERPRAGHKYVELEVQVAHIGHKPLSVDFRSLQLAGDADEAGRGSSPGEPYRLMDVSEVLSPAGQASGFTPGVRPRRVRMIFEVPASFTSGRLLYLGREVSRVSLSE